MDGSICQKSKDAGVWHTCTNNKREPFQPKLLSVMKIKANLVFLFILEALLFLENGVQRPVIDMH